MTQSSEMTSETPENQSTIAGASLCPSCESLCEFELPVSEGQFDIACYECAHIFEIDAASAAQTAISHELLATDETNLEAPAGLVTVTCLDCGGDISVSADALEDDSFVPHCPHCHASPGDSLANSALEQTIDEEEPIDFDAPTRFDTPLPRPAPTRSRGGLILVSIIAVTLVSSAALVALGLYFLTLRNDSDVAKYIETNILQLAPAKFDVQSASYEVSETELGTSLLVTITLTNSGEVEGVPEEMKVILTDAQNQPLVSWPLDTAGQIIAPGETSQLYTRLFEPPADFSQLRVLVR